jgi:hypothetical protein
VTRLVPGLRVVIAPQSRPQVPEMSNPDDSADFSVQVLDFIDLPSAFFVIVLSQRRMNACSGGATPYFCTKLST